MRILNSINHTRNEFVKQMNYEFGLRGSAPRTRRDYWFDVMCIAETPVFNARYDRRGIRTVTDAQKRWADITWLRWMETDA
jgi:hypothetical protein